MFNRLKKAVRKLFTRGGWETLGNFPRTSSDKFLSWFITGLSADAEIYRNLRLARAKCRAMDGGDEPSPYFRKILSELENNVIGSEGIVLQMKILETADRVVYAADEKALIEDYESRRNERMTKIVKRLRRRFPGADIPNPEPFHLLNIRQGNATVLAGQPDIYANNQVEAAWKEWCKKENCTVTRQLEFHEVEKIVLRGEARDGEALVRIVKGFDNPFGFALQIIDPDWLDINYNEALPNGNRVVMGVELNPWKEPVAFHVLKAQNNAPTWFFGVPYGGQRERVDAKEIIHVFTRERIDQNRGVPWLMSLIASLKMLGKYEEAELLASMAAACKVANYYNDLDPTAELPPGVEIDPNTGEFIDRLTPGQVSVSKYGWKMELLNPTHPNGNYGDFRKGVLRGAATGAPGATYYGISQDLEAVNFSSMQGGDRESRESYMMLQHHLIGNLHAKIFPVWLEMALMSGQIPLPISKIEKFNKPNWHGRRWKPIDALKAVTSKILEIENGFTSRQRVIAEMTGDDYEEIMLELAYEDEFESSLGLSFGATKLSQVGKDAYQQSDGTDESEAEAGDKVVAAASGKALVSRRNKKPVNGNGARK
jgi:lambda family phage portal protein